MAVRSGFRRHIGFLTLFTVLTSTALNTLTLARFRREERRLHGLQCAFLAQVYEQVRSTSPRTRISIEEQARLARRVRALQLDPLRLGISLAALPSHELQERARLARLAETSWSEALFGVGTLTRIRKALGKAVDRLRGRERTEDEEDIVAISDTDEEDMRAWIDALERAEGVVKEEKKDEGRAGKIDKDDVVVVSQVDKSNAKASQTSAGLWSYWTSGVGGRTKEETDRRWDDLTTSTKKDDRRRSPLIV